MRAALRLGGHGRRGRGGRFVVEGPGPVAAALGHPRRLVRELFVTATAAGRHRSLVQHAQLADVPVRLVTPAVMGRLSRTVTAPGLLAVADRCDVPVGQFLRPGARLVAVLVGVRDPGNAGTLLRTAAAAGADGVVFTAASVDPYNPKCVRASAGSLFHLPFGCAGDPAPLLARLTGAGLALRAADPAGTVDLYSLSTAGELAGPTAWLFGNESHGLAGQLLGQAQTVRIPVHGPVQSLNLAVAAGLCLYESARAHRSTAGDGA